MTLNERLMSMDGRYKSNAGAIAETTRPEGLSVPALRVGSKKAPLGVACMDAGKEREQEALSFARHLFGMTKLRSSRLDWRFFRPNRGDSNSVNRP